MSKKVMYNISDASFAHVCTIIALIFGPVCNPGVQFICGSVENLVHEYFLMGRIK